MPLGASKKFHVLDWIEVRKNRFVEFFFFFGKVNGEFSLTIPIIRNALIIPKTDNQNIGNQFGPRLQKNYSQCPLRHSGVPTT